MESQLSWKRRRLDESLLGDNSVVRNSSSATTSSSNSCSMNSNSNNSNTLNTMNNHTMRDDSLGCCCSTTTTTSSSCCNNSTETTRFNKQQEQLQLQLQLQQTEEDNNMTITNLVNAGRWDDVTERAINHPQEVIVAPNPSPLAIACRCGAPYECIKALLQAAPERIRYLLDSRGTPLHEAIVCESTGPNVIEALLTTDESLTIIGSNSNSSSSSSNHDNDNNGSGSSSSSTTTTTRAALLQDVDGFVPLHLLIRRRFQSHIQSLDEDMSLMEILELLVRSCPEAVIVPDRGEYEEPPLVYALKANIYAPSLGSEERTLARVERQIYEIVQTMLRYAPFAAARVFSGFRGQYTALHSAVFHGRYTATIDLILQTESLFPYNQQAALLANTQGELPLHFCAMRGERPSTVALLAKAAPSAVLYRDASGLTPFHWLWIRFISTLMAMDEDGRDFTVMVGTKNNRSTVVDDNDNNNHHHHHVVDSNMYNEFTLIEQGDFDVDLQLIRRLDPPVDFLRMRHIPPEVSGTAEVLSWCNRFLDVLNRIRTSFYTSRESVHDSEISLSRQDAVVSLFWSKVVSLLLAANEGADDGQPCGECVLVHTAFASTCCLPAVAYLTASLFSEEITTIDNNGRLPLHYAVSRQWHAWDWPREDGSCEHPAARLLSQETLDLVRIAIHVSPSYAARISDNVGRIPLHYIIETFIRAGTQGSRSMNDDVIADIIKVLHELVALYPEGLQQRDGITKLYPFLQAAAIATELSTDTFIHEELNVSLTYELLRQNPSLLCVYSSPPPVSQ